MDSRIATAIRDQVRTEQRRQSSQLFGVVVFVTAEQIGAELKGDHASGVQTLLVYDSSEMAEFGRLQVGDDVYTYDSTTSVEDPDDLTAVESVHLTTVTTAAYSDGALVNRYPLKRYRHKTALVQVASVDPDSPTDLVEAAVRPKMRHLFKVGPRQDGDGEQVSLIRKHGLWVVDEIHGEAPVIDSGDLDEESTPPSQTLANAFLADPAPLVGTFHPSGLAGGSASAPIEFVNAKMGGWQGSSSGVAFTKSGGGVAFSATDDGTRVNADVVEALTARVSGRAEVQGLDIPAGGDITLRTGVEPPGAPPGGTQDWPSQPVDLQGVIAANRHSLGLKSLTEAYNLISTAGGATRLQKWNPTTRVFSSSSTFKSQPTATSILSGGYSTKADKWLNLEYDAEADAYLVPYYATTTGAYDHGWTATQLGGSNGNRPALSVHTSGGVEYVMLARSKADGTVQMWEYHDEAYVSTVTSADAFSFGDLEACTYQGSVVYLTGMTHMTDSSPYPGQPVMPVVNFGSFFGTPGTTAGYLPVAAGDVRGSLATYDGDTWNRTWYLSRVADVLYQHGDVFRSGSQCIKVTGYDTGTGHETEPSDAGFFTYVPGKRITLTMGAPAAGAPYDQYRVYLGAAPGAVDPGDASMWLQGATSGTSYCLEVFPVLVAGTNLTASRTAPTAPGLGGIKADDGTVLVAGDKTGLLFDIAGSFLLSIEVDEMTGDIVIEEVIS